MKTKKFNKKLSLRKETIANLKGKELDAVRGGQETIDTCAMTNGCPTDFLCTDPKMGECSAVCTLPCPVTTVIPC